MKLYVVRHGETAINVKRLVNSWNMIGLNDKGRMQARNAGDKLQEEPIDLIICSPLIRTKQTCKLINKKKKRVIYDKRLLERNARSMQFKSIEILDWDKWYDPKQNVIYSDTEGFKSVLDRINLFIEELKEKYMDKNILIVTHGDVCKAFYSNINKISDVDKIKAYKHGNCEIKIYNVN